MHIDLDRAELSQQLRARVCIIGAGVAGLLLATQLADSGLEILLLEAGGLEPEERSQELYRAAMSAANHAGTTEGRFRIFGGSSTRWGGQLLPYSADIFSPPEGTPSAAWPITEADVAPYYEELQRLLGVNALPFDASLLAALGRQPVSFTRDFSLRFSKWIPFARRNFAHTLGRQALAHPRITVVTHANVAELLCTGGRITHARVLDYNRREFRAEAETFLVATGTIESSRLLLLSRSVPHANAQFGRGFHDHISWPAAEFTGEARKRVLRLLGPFFVDGTLHTFKLEASSQLRAREHLLATMAHVSIEEPEDSGAAALKRMFTSLQRGEHAEALHRNLFRMLRSLPGILRVVYAARVLKRRAVSSRARVTLRIDLEQPPESQRSIGLSEERDALGLPKAVVAWHVGEQEIDTARRYADIVREQLQTLDLSPKTWSGEPMFADTFHAMGGLRMGHDPASSAVDTDLRVHGVQNLYVASCAVFPSGGSSNPTFTLMCLALRLAKRISSGSRNSAEV